MKTWFYGYSSRFVHYYLACSVILLLSFYFETNGRKKTSHFKNDTEHVSNVFITTILKLYTLAKQKCIEPRPSFQKWDIFSYNDLLFSIVLPMKYRYMLHLNLFLGLIGVMSRYILYSQRNRQEFVVSWLLYCRSSLLLKRQSNTYILITEYNEKCQK